MVKKPAKKTVAANTRTARRSKRKVTYSLPESLAHELDRRKTESGRSRSRMVAEALAFYFSEQDKGALASIYAEAATDPLFLEDNEAVRVDFAGLDGEADSSDR
jgi:hypothetical protein